VNFFVNLVIFAEKPLAALVNTGVNWCISRQHLCRWYGAGLPDGSKFDKYCQKSLFS